MDGAFGYNMPRARMIELGETDGFLGRLLHSGSHEESIRMVAMGQVDASSVVSLVLDYALEKQAGYAQDVKIIEVLGPLASLPLSHRRNCQPQCEKGYAAP